MGLFGIGNYEKAGAGVSKDEGERRRFFLFFELLWHKMPKLFLLNLLFVAFSIPLITIGAALTGSSAVLYDISTRRGTFVWADFWGAFKRRFFASTALWIIDLALAYVVFIGLQFYYNDVKNEAFALVGICAISFVGILAIFANFYAFTMFARTELKFKEVIKNSVLLAIGGVWTNLITLIITLVFVAVAMIWPLVALFLIPFGILIFWQFIVVFNSSLKIDKYVIKKEKEAEVEKVFSDEHEAAEDVE